MGILSEIAIRLKGHECEMLIKRTRNEITLSGANFGMADIKIDLASFSNKLIELVKATQVAVALDDSQYLMCKELSGMDKDDELKNDCQRIRLMLIMSFSQLRAILGTLSEQPTDEIKQQLNKWIQVMGELNQQSIKILEPGPKMISKGPKIAQIMKYQGVDEAELQDAISLM
jgi:C4-dicarboxylate-specific signal transduction histidine kinase